MTRALHVEAWGDPANPRVVCLHGVTGHGGGFRWLAEEWLDDYYVVAPDLLGDGLVAVRASVDIAEHLSLIEESLGTEPAVWIGIRSAAASRSSSPARHPGLVARLVLLDPAILIDPGIALHVAEASRAQTGRMRPSTRASSGASSRAPCSGLRGIASSGT